MKLTPFVMLTFLGAVVCLLAIEFVSHPVQVARPDLPDCRGPEKTIAEVRAFVTELLKKAERGDVESEYRLGVMYSQGVTHSQGQILPKDNFKMLKWYREAAEHGHGSAQSKLAVMYQHGRDGVAKNEAEAIKWYRKLDEQLYAETVKWFRTVSEAAEKGEAAAQYSLGTAFATGLKYEQGQIAPKDEVQAVKLFLKAAENGNPQAQLKLAIMYQYGQGGVPKNEAESLKWYRAVPRPPPRPTTN